MKASLIAKVAYALLFTVLLPWGLAAWAKATAPLFKSPVIPSVTLGAAVCAAGAALILSGWIALWFYGGGLPMNISPPPRLVTRGIYGLIPHPIYTGFALLCAGVAILNRSASGFWLITPFVILGSFALLWGYELPDLAARFGIVQAIPCRALPPDAESPQHHWIVCAATCSFYFHGWYCTSVFFCWACRTMPGKPICRSSIAFRSWNGPKRSMRVHTLWCSWFRSSQRAARLCDGSVPAVGSRQPLFFQFFWRFL